VATKVPTWLSKPDLILHIGLAPGRKFFTLEKQAMCGPYSGLKDVDGQVLPDVDAEKLFGPDCPKSLNPTIDCEDVWKRWGMEVKDRSADLRTGTDTSVGLYLCGFIYFLSLNWFWMRKAAERPVLFLHVPDLPTQRHLDQGLEVGIGLIRAMVASRKEKGIYDPRHPHGVWDRTRAQAHLNEHLT